MNKSNDLVNIQVDAAEEAKRVNLALAATLRGLRARRRMTQEALADAANMNKKTVQRLEAGERAMTINQLYRLSRALGVKPSEFVTDIESEIGIQ
ncbi:helix-turn-helix domain-containing protein [Nocardia sp. NPDC058480]|uniref:helix-turn-helix domain-containing protein n=1 Tax=unclassified Nocardia TaxID=2637762 RepID=UPI00364EF827